MGCSPCAQPLEIAAAIHTVPHQALATGASNNTRRSNRNVARLFTPFMIQANGPIGIQFVAKFTATVRKDMGVFPASLLLASLVTAGFGCYLITRGRAPAMVPPPQAIQPAEPVLLTPSQDGKGAPEKAIAMRPGSDVLLLLHYAGHAPTGLCRAALRDATGKQSAVETTACGMDTHAFTLPSSLPAGPYVVELRDSNGNMLSTYSIRVTR